MAFKTFNILCTDSNQRGRCVRASVPINRRVSALTKSQLNVGLPNLTSLRSSPTISYQELYIFHDQITLFHSRIDAQKNYFGPFTRIDLPPEINAERSIDLRRSWTTNATSVYNITTREFDEARIPTRAFSSLVLRLLLSLFLDMIPGGFLSVGSNRLIGSPQFYWYPHPQRNNEHGIFPEYQYLCITQILDIRTAWFAGKKIKITLFIRVFEDQGRLRFVLDGHHFWGERGFAYDQVRDAVSAFIVNESGTINAFFDLLSAVIPSTISGAYLLPGFQLRNRLSDGYNIGFERHYDNDSEATIVLENPTESELSILQALDNAETGFDAFFRSIR